MIQTKISLSTLVSEYASLTTEKRKGEAEVDKLKAQLGDLEEKLVFAKRRICSVRLSFMMSHPDSSVSSPSEVR